MPGLTRVASTVDDAVVGAGRPAVFRPVASIGGGTVRRARPSPSGRRGRRSAFGHGSRRPGEPREPGACRCGSAGGVRLRGRRRKPEGLGNDRLSGAQHLGDQPGQVEAALTGGAYDAGQHLLGCARQTGGGWPVRVRRKEGVTNHLHPESCAGRREAAGEAVQGRGWAGLLSIESVHVWSAETVPAVEGHTDITATGEVMEGSTVSGTQARPYVLRRDLGGLHSAPAVKPMMHE